MTPICRWRFSAIFSSFAHSAGVMAMGFSLNTLTPASSASCDSREWVACGVAMITAWSCSSATIVLMSSYPWICHWEQNVRVPSG
jgi:hypothetical protein